jgi:hypothetical protein
MFLGVVGYFSKTLVFIEMKIYRTSNMTRSCHNSCSIGGWGQVFFGDGMGVVAGSWRGFGGLGVMLMAVGDRGMM